MREVAGTPLGAAFIHLIVFAELSLEEVVELLTADTLTLILLGLLLLLMLHLLLLLGIGLLRLMHQRALAIIQLLAWHTCLFNWWKLLRHFLIITCSI